MLLALPAWAQIDRRDPFSVELGVGAAWLGSATARSGRLVDGGMGQLRLSAFAPYSDGFQGGVGAFLGVSGTGIAQAGALVGLRFLSGFEQWQTRVDGQLLGAVWPVLGIGARLAFGGVWRVAPGLRLGGELGAMFIAGNTRVGADASLVLLYSW